MDLTQFRALISDLDDTLLTAEHELTDRTADTLARVMRLGVKVILASGRSAASMRPIVEKAGTPSPYIAYNGAQIVDAATHQVIHAEEIPLALAREVLSWLEGENVYTQIYGGDDWFYDQNDQIAKEYGHATGVAGTRVARLLDFIHAPTPKVLGVDLPERVAELIEKGRARFGDALSITTSKPHFLEITSPRATKGDAARTLAGMLGLTPETTLCAGDSLNDMSMLSWSRCPIAVSNAREEVRRMAWRVAGDGRADGLANLLDELITEE